MLLRSVPEFYSHVNYSVTKITLSTLSRHTLFYSHVNYSVTKMNVFCIEAVSEFYSHVNYSVTKIWRNVLIVKASFTVT